MAAFKTTSIPTFHAPKPSVPKVAKMPSLRLPTMKTGGTSLPKASVAPVRGFARPAMPSMGSAAIAKAASSASPTAAGPSAAGAGWRNIGRVRRPQQDSPFGFLSQ